MINEQDASLSSKVVQGLWPDFGENLKIRKRSKFDRNQLKLSTQHKNMYMYRKNYKNYEFSPRDSWSNLAKDHVLYSTGSLT